MGPCFYHPIARSAAAIGWLQPRVVCCVWRRLEQSLHIQNMILRRLLVVSLYRMSERERRSAERESECEKTSSGRDSASVRVRE